MRCAFFVHIDDGLRSSVGDCSGADSGSVVMPVAFSGRAIGVETGLLSILPFISTSLVIPKLAQESQLDQWMFILGEALNSGGGRDWKVSESKCQDKSDVISFKL